MGTKQSKSKLLRIREGVRGTIEGVKQAVGRLSPTPPDTPKFSETPPDLEEKDRFIEAVLSLQNRVSLEKDPDETIKTDIRSEADVVHVVERSERRVLYANDAGHGLLRKMQNLENKVAALQTSNDEQQKKNNEQRKTNDQQQKTNDQQLAVNLSLTADINQTRPIADHFRDIRWRLYAVYKRDVKGMTHLRRSREIREGNEYAHEGKALLDARLFRSDRFRQDVATYSELYGMDFQQVLRYRGTPNDGILFAILDAHATMLLQGKALGRALDKAFKAFLTHVEKSGLAWICNGVGYDRRYWDFWNEHAKQEKQLKLAENQQKS